ncbi:MAG TPA: SRPBCC domain-containing protein, partial [Fimbriimonadaceae bacterium]|nr:SRPBCC domain-containing protein [Fimbriimonadaceae bacterium]
MKDRIELETTYPHSPDLVWHALTDPEALGKWLMPCDLEPLIGFRFRFQRPDGSSIKGQVTDVELSRLLAYR